ncbi:hypothetical protein SCHPADRAFT_832213 [Schizopora paradoxa]|uniref:Protein transport protein sec16 n=1 Tax=Schizopora paradoxa TaxID=27342 RepID=A0A0H2RGH6_9AGAM|nr:hypothetical protein SCHPADRAFT_832213 [Schizopora paradoxa]
MSARSSLEKTYSPPPITGPYAPSPSLSGTNDPLGRTRVRVPVVQFGFGGKLITCFHSSPLVESGYDYNGASNKSTDITIRSLHKLLPDSSLEASTVTFPGPLFGDSGSPVATLAITTSATSAKAKKTKVLSYLDERAKELEQGLGYHSVGSPEHRSTEGKLVLVRLLHAMVENDGHVSGSPAAISAARKALLPHLSSSTEGADVGSAHLTMNISAPDRGSNVYQSFGSSMNPDQTFAEYVVRTSALDKIQSFLLRGELRQAYHFALDEKLWAHAMVIAHGLDKDAFKEVAEEFIKTELGVKGGSIVNGRECLRLAYGLYAGQASTAVQQLLPSKLSNGPTMTTLTVQPPTPLNHMTPMSPSFPSVAVATGVPPEALNKWQEYVAILLSGQAGTESSSALTTLGDYLVTNDWVEAGHCCYLLSPQTSPFGGVGTPAARIVLLGAQSPVKNTTFYRDSDCFTFSETVEYALSLRAPVKGQEAFGGFPHFQAYRLVRAQQLAELGHIAAAKRYCDAILTCTNRASPYLTTCLLEQLSDFSKRLHGNIELDKSSSWMGNKISKPSLDSIGGWLGGTLSKFVAGEADPPSPMSREGSISESATYSGAFQHYSAISSANPSRGPSPAPSLSSVPNPPPAQWKSGTTHKSLYNSQNPISRASSAIDHLRPGSRKNTPPPRVASANPMTTTFAQSRTLPYGTGLHNNDIQSYNGEPLSDTSESQGGGWWNAAYGDAGGPTPTASSFDHHSEYTTADTNGFISPVDSYQSSTSSVATPSSQHMEEEEFDDELGLGNSAHKSKKPASSEQNASANEQSAKVEPKKEEGAPKKPELKSATSSSWLGRLWSRGSTPAASTPGPVKANLGEQSSFYYDKDLKRWVNKKAGAEETKTEALPPPPPSRAQTVSPSRIAPGMSASKSFPPPPRPMSAAEPGMGPPLKSLPRIQSNLVPHPSTDSAPPTPAVMSGITGAPPTGRSKSAAAAKRGARNRYVDVFENGA